MFHAKHFFRLTEMCRIECSEGGVHDMLLEVGQASHVVLTKSESRNYERRTQFE